MQPHPLSDQQQALADHRDGHLYAEACPGAGKTRAISARYLRRVSEEPRKGIALLSFTTAAIEEVKRRCGERPDALRAPHFVGTFDSFINRFISRPLYVHYYGKTPRFIESWQDTRHGTFRLGGMDGLPSLGLDWFMFDLADGQPRAVLSDDLIPPGVARQLKNYISANRARTEKRADQRCRALVRGLPGHGGLLTCSVSRALATCLLQRATVGPRLGRLLANRFSEVIVDEAQDCGPEELLILRVLKQHGVTVVAVADLDQSIFAFRRADPDGVRTFTGELGTQITLVEALPQARIYLIGTADDLDRLVDTFPLPPGHLMCRSAPDWEAMAGSGWDAVYVSAAGLTANEERFLMSEPSLHMRDCPSVLWLHPAYRLTIA